MDHELDAIGLKCPLPVLKARKALQTVAIGENLWILVTDPGAPGDFEHFCTVTGNEWLGAEPSGPATRIGIRRRV